MFVLETKIFIVCVMIVLVVKSLIVVHCYTPSYTVYTLNIHMWAKLGVDKKSPLPPIVYILVRCTKHPPKSIHGGEMTRHFKDSMFVKTFTTLKV